MIDVVKDVSVLSNIPEKIIIKLLKKFAYCICEGVEEDILEGTEISSLDMGIGILYIKHPSAGDPMQYKFVIDKYLEKALKDTFNNKANLLEDTLNKSLVAHFMDVYKGLC
jgi:hypothetical protein